MLVILIICLLLCLYMKYDTGEHFTQDPNAKYLIQENLKKDKYMEFLSDVNVKFKSTNSADPNSALGYAFSKQPSQSLQEDIDRKILNTNELAEIGVDTDDICRHKAASLCTRTDPRMYISDDGIRFPPRWLIKTYANQVLPMNIDVKCYNKMYSCCKR